MCVIKGQVYMSQSLNTIGAYITDILRRKLYCNPVLYIVVCTKLIPDTRICKHCSELIYNHVFPMYFNRRVYYVLGEAAMIVSYVTV